MQWIIYFCSSRCSLLVHWCTVRLETVKFVSIIVLCLSVNFVRLRKEINLKLGEPWCRVRSGFSRVNFWVWVLKSWSSTTTCFCACANASKDSKEQTDASKLGECKESEKEAYLEWVFIPNYGKRSRARCTVDVVNFIDLLTMSEDA